MAIALDWKGQVDTNLSWATLFASPEHTLVVRFLPAYAYACDGPLVSSSSASDADAFEVGLGQFPGVDRVRVLLPCVRMRVAGQDRLFESGDAMPAGRTFADFDGGTYGGWATTGTCFGAAPATGTLPNQNPVQDFLGHGLVNTFLGGSDAMQGTLTSPEFTIDRPFIRFLVGGGHHPGTCCVNLVVGAQIVRTVTGNDDERLAWHCWDVRDLMNARGKVEIVDRESGGWGHILADHFEVCDAPLLQPKVWQELALVWRGVANPRYGPGSQYTAYLNGEPLAAPLRIAMPFAPADTVRIGGPGFGRPRGQFYGLIDEVAVFTSAFSTETLRERVRRPSRLTGTEPNLLAGWTFSSGAQPPKLDRPITLTGAASMVVTTPGLNSAADAAKLPLPANGVPAVLPFPLAEAWQVIQEFDERLGSHTGWAAFCWDFVRATGPSEHALLLATAPGQVVTVQQADLTQEILVEVEAAPGEVHGFLHLEQNASSLTVGATVAVGTHVSRVGRFNHLHYAFGNARDGAAGFVTRPLAFRNYERQEPDGSWTHVAVGMPRKFEIVRQDPKPLIVTLSPAKPAYGRQISLTVRAKNPETGGETEAVVGLSNSRNGVPEWRMFPANRATSVTLNPKLVGGPGTFQNVYPSLTVSADGFRSVTVQLT